jgi:hypothetical protein
LPRTARSPTSAAALSHPVLRSIMIGGEQRAETLRTLASGATLRADSPTGMREVLPPGGAADEVVRAVTFHQSQQAEAEPVDDNARRAALQSSVDFHKIISSLTEHPALLRHLGLVVHIGVPRSTIATAGGTVRLLPQWTSLLDSAGGTGQFRKIDRRLWMGWRLDPAAVQPFTAASRRVAGVLDIGARSAFSVQSLALDSAVLQAVSMVATLPPEGERTAPPALRSAGLMILLEDRGQATHSDIAAAVAGIRGASPGSALAAEDIVRGYRLDVFDLDRNAWQSLHARQVTYAVQDAPLIDPVDDEGSHHPSATGPPVEPGAEPGATAPIFLHESFVRWDGWSLSAPRPGRSLSVDPSGPDPTRPETMPQRTTNDPLTQAGLRIETRVQSRSLPRLRFGHRYQLRIRTVDLAGIALDLAQANAMWQRPLIPIAASGQRVAPAELGSATVRFARFEPVPPPVIIQSNPEPESPHLLVVRSGTDDPALAVTRVECRLFAPKGSVELAEWHGMFDDAIGSGNQARVRASYDVAARGSGVLPNAGSDELPYLPDPLSIGVAIAGALGVAPGTTPGIEWRGSSWDRPKPITLRVEVNDLHFQPGPLPDQDGLLITIKLDPARRARLRISSLIPDGTPFGLLDWLGEDKVDGELDEDQRRALRRAIDDSRHVMFTPWDTLEVVHAVQRPLAAPDLREEPEVARRPGDTDFQTNCSLIPEPLSTGSIQLGAQWTDVVDDPAVRLTPPAPGAAMPWLRPVSTVVGSTDLDEPQLVEGVLPLETRTDIYAVGSTLPRLQFADTKRREVTFTATAVSRFAAFFGEFVNQPDRFTRTGSPARAEVQSTARPAAPVVVDAVPIVSTANASTTAGVTVREGGWLRIWLARPWFSTGTGEMLGVVVMNSTPLGPEDPMYDLVSVAGTDAAHAGPSFAGLRPEHFVGVVAVESGVVLPESLDRLGQPPTVSIAQYAPEFDFETQRWFVDLQVEPFFGLYFPMIRLAVVRYQPTSVPGDTAPDGTPRSAHHYKVSPVVLLDPMPLFPHRRLVVKKVIKPTHSLLMLELSGPTYTATTTLQSEPTAKAFALSQVVARPQARAPVEFAAGGEHWFGSTEIRFKRQDPSKPWRLQLEDDQLRDLGPDVERILVIEQDHVPFDPAMPTDGEWAPRTIFAAVVEGPFLPGP